MMQSAFYPPNPMENLIIIANLGRVRPLNYKPAGDDPLEEAHLLEEPEDKIELRPQHIHEVVTDHAGRFSQGGPLGVDVGMSYGEERHLKAELEKQALERIAAKIGEIVAEQNYPLWRLVFPQENLPSLLEALPAAAHRVLSDIVTGDLTKIPLVDLERRFITHH